MADARSNPSWEAAKAHSSSLEMVSPPAASQVAEEVTSMKDEGRDTTVGCPPLPCVRVAVAVSAVPPEPSCPNSPLPKQATLWVSKMTQVCRPPTETLSAVRPGPRLTGGRGRGFRFLGRQFRGCEPIQILKVTKTDKHVEESQNSDDTLRSGRVVPHPAPQNIEKSFSQKCSRTFRTSILGYSGVFGGPKFPLS